jgi:hypothetical protein
MMVQLRYGRFSKRPGLYVDSALNEIADLSNYWLDGQRSSLLSPTSFSFAKKQEDHSVVAYFAYRLTEPLPR